MNHPTTPPATSGTAPDAQCSGVPGPGSGTAASSGNGGSSGAGAEASGSTTCPVPSTKPGPRAYAAAHTAAFGTSVRHSSSTANRPAQSSVSRRYASCAAPACHTSETASSSAPPPTSTAAPAPAARVAAPRRASGSTISSRSVRGSTRSARPTGPPGRPNAVHTPAPAAPMVTRGRHTAAHPQEGRSAPPAEYSTTGVATAR